jgi:transposase
MEIIGIPPVGPLGPPEDRLSKARLDAFRLHDGARQAVKNDQDGVEALAQWAGKTAIFVMEASGSGACPPGPQGGDGGERLAHRQLAEQGRQASIMNPARVRDFANALGRLAKTDRIRACPPAAQGADRGAETIARFGAFTRPAPTPLASTARRELGELLAYRRQVQDEIAAREQQLRHLTTPRLRHQAEVALQSLKATTKALDADLQAVIKADPQLADNYRLLTSMPGCGPVLAATLLADLPPPVEPAGRLKLGTLDRRQIASLTGTAPIARDSGTKSGKRPTRGGRSSVRKTLSMASLSLTQGTTPQTDFYRRLVARGKAKKLALVATMRKMLVTLNAMLRHRQPYNPNHLTSPA